METKELEQKLDDLKGALNANMKDELTKAVVDVQKAIDSGLPDKIKKAVTENIETINKGLKELSDWKTEKSDADQKNQQALDNIIVQLKDINKNTKPIAAKNFSEVFAAKMAEEEVQAGLKKVSKGKPYLVEFKNDDGSPLRIDMSTKAVGPMLVSNNLTGDSVATYRSGAAILPAQKINFRDLIPTVQSDTGLYVHYKETGGEGSFTEQTEGSSKAQIDYDLTEVKTVNKYVSGFTRFSKQLMRSLPFLQNTLVRMLLRDFYKEENSYFFDTVSAAALGSTTTSETDDVKALMDWIGAHQQANFSTSFVLTSHTQMTRLNKLLYTNGYYQGSGGVMSMPDGSARISGIPIIPASWVTDDKALLVDNDFLERIEVESLRVEFFEQDSDNVQKNLMTVRVECYEEINPMIGSAFTYGDFGNV